MKSRLLIILLLCLFQFNSFGQKISSKELLGRWDIEDSLGSHISLEFIDSLNVIFLIDGKLITKLQYRLENQLDLTIINLDGSFYEGRPQYICWTIKKINDGLFATKGGLINIFKIPCSSLKNPGIMRKVSK